MIRLDMEQGSEEWFQARVGVITGSRADRLVTPTGRVSAQLTAYAAELAGERLKGAAEDGFKGEWMERGSKLEPRARLLYEVMTDREAEVLGFVYRDERLSEGASPDAFVEDGGLEIKCPKLSTHMLYLYEAACPPKYFPQVQFNMMITGRDWWDFMSYHPDVKPMITRVERNDKFIDALSDAAHDAAEIRDNILEKVQCHT